VYDLPQFAQAGLILLGRVAQGSNPPSNSVSDSTVKVAIVTAIGLVVATAITAFASTFKREPSRTGTATQNETFTRQYISGLEKDRRELGKLRINHQHLREACLDRGLDPDDLIREQVNAT
jgi:hypothetical protein